MRRDNGTAQHLERHIHALVGRRRAPAPAHRDGCGGLRLDELSARKADPLPKREERACRLPVVDRRADDDAVRVLQLLDYSIGRVVAERALAQALRPALAAGDASANGLVASPDRLGFDAFRRKRVGYFPQGARRVAVCTRASIDEQYFHIVPFLVLN